MTHDEMIEVLTEAREIVAGRSKRTIQRAAARFIGINHQQERTGEWWNIDDLSDVCWGFNKYMYRVKPEPPQVRWVNVYQHTRESWSHATREGAVQAKGNECIKAAVPFVEITPEVRAALAAQGIEVPNE